MHFMDFINDVKDICDAAIALLTLGAFFKKNLNIKFHFINKQSLYDILKKPMTSTTSSRTTFKKVHKYNRALFLKKAVNDSFRVNFKKINKCHTTWLLKKTINTSFTCSSQVTLVLCKPLKKAIEFTFREHIHIKKPYGVTVCYLLKKAICSPGFESPLAIFNAL
jgi:hypothetical protein